MVTLSAYSETMLRESTRLHFHQLEHHLLQALSTMRCGSGTQEHGNLEYCQGYQNIVWILPSRQTLPVARPKRRFRNVVITSSCKDSASASVVIPDSTYIPSQSSKPGSGSPDGCCHQKEGRSDIVISFPFGPLPSMRAVIHGKRSVPDSKFFSGLDL